MIFQTVSGSLYELDRSNNRIRRLIGINNPTDRQGKDGEWKQYSTVSAIKVGIPVVIVWEMYEHDKDLVQYKTTVTSNVVDINVSNN